MRKRIICTLMCAYLALPAMSTIVLAEGEDTTTVVNSGVAVAGTATNPAAGTSTETNVNADSSVTGSGGSSGLQINPDADAAESVDAFGSLFGDLGNPLDSEAAHTTSKTVAPIVASIIGFFGKLIPLCILAYTGLELACIAVPPLRPVFGAASGGGMEGGSKKVALQVSEDCIAVIKGGSGGMEGGGGGGKGEGLSSMFMKYLKLRSVTLVVCLVTMGILLTPFGYNIILKIVELIFSGISKIMSFLG